MKDVIIGAVTGLAAVLLTTALRPAAPPPTSTGRGLPTVVEPDVEHLVGRYLPTTRPDPAAERLAQPVAGFDGAATSLDEAFDRVAAAAGVNLYVDWPALEQVGVRPKDRVRAKIQGGPASAVLKALLKDAGGSVANLAYCAEDGVVQVSTSEDLARISVTRVYRVRDLVERAMTRAPKSATLGGAGTEEEICERLIKTLRNAIEPTSWREEGGLLGSVWYFDGRLVVTQTPENHESILGLLSALRRTE